MRLLLALALTLAQPLMAEPVVIGHPGLQPLQRKTLQRIYSGKVVEVAGVRVTPINLPPGNPLRERFLERYLEQSEDGYIGYWTVRRYVGKGTPPREVESAQDVIRFVSRTAGAIGYVDTQDLAEGLNVLLQSP